MTTRTLRFFGSNIDGDVTMLVTVNNQTVFDGTIARDQQGFLFEAHGIPLDFSGSLPMTVSIIRGSVTLGTVQISHDRIPNLIYNQENLSRFRSAETWTQKVSILCELANPSFTQEQIEFLLLEDPEHWVAQEKILGQHGCELTVIDPNSWREAKLYDKLSDDPNDVRQHVTLNGILQVVPRGPGLNGTWSWTIHSGDVLACDLIISPTPTVHDMPRELIVGAYPLPGLTMDFLDKIQLTNELKRPEIKILDIGTGYGEISKELKKIHVQGQVHGLDVPNAKHYIGDNSILPSNIAEYDEFIEADLRYPLPISNSIYDVVICSNVLVQTVMELENIPRLTADCLDEILRILTPGGIFICHIDRLCWVEFDQKIKQLTSSNQISVLGQSWIYHREKLCMYPPVRLCLAVRKN
jgi:ubiquinone/menaquinone biosynthesis C-methylase UbiE